MLKIIKNDNVDKIYWRRRYIEDTRLKLALKEKYVTNRKNTKTTS